MPFTAPKPISPAPDDLRGAKVLVVDDERSWRVILETDLRMIGYKVSMAEDADQALERAGAESPEVAIIDLMLPEPMDGWGLLNALRTRGQKLPVIFYTAYPVFPSGTDDPDVVGYMSKAVDRADLYALLNKWRLREVCAAAGDPALTRAPGERNYLDDYHHQLMNQSTHPAPEATASVATTPSAKAPRTTLTCHVIEFTPWKFPN